MMSDGDGSYLLSGQSSELARLQLQSRVWEPAGRSLLDSLSRIDGARALEVGCGVMGWLRILSDWVGPEGSVVGTDVDEKMLAGAQTMLDEERLTNVQLHQDDIFSTQMAPAAFDLVHARFQIAPLGRPQEHMDAFRRLVKSGGWLVLEDPDMASWRVHPDAPHTHELIGLIAQGFEEAGGDFNSGVTLPFLMKEWGVEPSIRANVVALEPGHPYLRLPLQFAESLRTRLEALAGRPQLDELIDAAQEELGRPDVWGTTFTLIQACGRFDD